MASNNQDFNADNLFRGNSALGAQNPAFEDQRKAGNRNMAIADIEDALLLASKYTIAELSRMTQRSVSQIESMIKLSITKVAKFRGVERADIKAAFDEAQQTNGVNIRRYRETSVLGAVGDANGRVFFPLQTNNSGQEQNEDTAMEGGEDADMGGMDELFEGPVKQQEPDAVPAESHAIALPLRLAAEHQAGTVDAFAASANPNLNPGQEELTEEEDVAFTMLKLAGVLKMNY
ncbi:hypothetical protein HII31_04229 [Pseudocercospora fuligena]|uniref:Uncharacterized protein n=1 Tax=Pseudocercospora fuligena TaxID=685502 RepID=A0A8H6RN15_9PEZI|nr:hypothetical protein HII31_04229 [Pseudocercospora fuligena]